MPGRPCQTCTHAKRDELDRALRRGDVTRRELAARYGIGQASLDRHARKHLGHDDTQDRLATRQREIANRIADRILDIIESEPPKRQAALLLVVQAIRKHETLPATVLGYGLRALAMEKENPADSFRKAMRELAGTDMDAAGEPPVHQATKPERDPWGMAS